MASRCSPLAGIRVIDFGHYVAGPLAGLLLAEQGAEVIRIERPGAAAIRFPLAAVLNRGKRSVALDLKTESGHDAAVALAESADVVIENFRPGVMVRLGLGAEAMTARNPRLVYLSLPGFASDDSSYSRLPAWEGIIGAACGLYTDVNLLKEFLGLPPVYSALPYGSVYGATHGALAVVMALVARERSGTGDVIEVPLVSAAMSGMASSVVHVASQPRRYDLPSIPRPIRWTLLPLLKRIAAQVSPRWQERAYQAIRGMIPALMTSYVCADNRLLHIFAIDHRRHARDLLARLGLLDEMKRLGLSDHDPYAAAGGRNNLSEGSGLPRRWQRELRARIAERLRSKPAEAWEAELAAAGIPCTVQRTTAEWLALKPLRSARIVVEVEDSDYGLMRLPGPHCWLREQPQASSAHRPAHGMSVEDDAQSAPETAAPRFEDRKSGADHIASVLNRVLVLDLSTMIAGPVCARTLAEYGADVIKIESPHPLHGPRMVCWFGIEVDQGKRSLLVDVTTQDGRNILHRLIERADVLVHNFSRSAIARLGLGMEDLARLNPRLVLCRLGAIEGPEAGPWDERKAYDPVVQAASGIMLRYGSPDQPEYHGLASCIDYLTGYCAALGAALALFKRTCDPNQIGGEAITSLAQGAHLAQAAFAFDFPGRVWNESCGQRSFGDRALHRLYRARDGWLFLAAPSEKCDALLAVPELGRPPGLACADDLELTRFLEARLRKKTWAQWERVFAPLDVAIFPVRTLQEIRRATLAPRPQTPYVKGGPSVQMFRQPHPVGCLVDTLAPAYARLRRQPIRYLDPAPKPGSHTMQILDEIGIEEAERQSLVDSGVVAVELCEKYLPP